MFKRLPILRSRLAIVIAGLLVVAIGLFIAWESWGKKTLIPRKFGVVEPGSIYRSGQISRFRIEDTLKEHKIGTVVFLSEDKDLVQDVSRPDVKAERETCQNLGITRYNFPLNGDGTGDIVQYANAVEAMVKSQQQFKPVLVHCHTGSQRTGAAVAFYRLLVQKKKPAEVYAELTYWEHDPGENAKLIPYVNDNLATLAQMLKERGVIDEVPAELPKLASR